MSTSDHRRFDDLMSRYLDASLDPAEEHELLQCLSAPDLALRFHELTKLDAEIAGVLAGSIRDEVMVELVWSDLRGSQAAPVAVQKTVPRATPAVPVVVRGKPKKRSGRLLALAAVFVCLLGVSAFYFSRTPPPTVAVTRDPAASDPAKIASVRGEVYFVGPSGRLPLTGGQVLESGGTIKTVGPDSRATLALTDGTEIALLGDSSFSAGWEAGKRRWFLEAGTLRSTVAKQPANAPMIFGTARVVATVYGTELTLIEEELGTYLIVTKGAVALRRSSGGPEVLVEAGYYAHVELEGNFHPWPIARLPKDLREKILLPI